MAIYNIGVRSVGIEPSRGGSTSFWTPFNSLSHWKRDVVGVAMRGQEVARRTSEGHSPLDPQKIDPVVLPAHDSSNLDRVHQHDVDSFTTPLTPHGHW